MGKNGQSGTDGRSVDTRVLLDITDYSSGFRLDHAQPGSYRFVLPISTDKRADGQETQEWLTLLPRLEGGRRDGTHSPIEAEAGS